MSTQQTNTIIMKVGIPEGMQPGQLIKIQLPSGELRTVTIPNYPNWEFTETGQKVFQVQVTSPLATPPPTAPLPPTAPQWSTHATPRAQKAPAVKRVAKGSFPPYDENCGSIQVNFQKRPKLKFSDRFVSSMKKLQNDLSTSAEKVQASGASINGYLLNSNQVSFLASTYNVRLRENTHYWYDHKSGFFGKIGGINQKCLDSNLEVKGVLDPRSSSGNMGIYINGREILPGEHTNWKRSGMNLEPGQRYVVDDIGNVTTENSDLVLWNWRKMHGDMIKKGLAMGAGAVLLGGLAGGEGAMFGGGGGADNFWSSGMTGAASNFDSSGAGYISFGDGSGVTIGM